MVGSKLNSNNFSKNKRQPKTNIDKLKNNTVRLEYANEMESQLKVIEETEND